MKSKGQQELDEYIFTRPEMAKLLGITTNALRCRMRKGKCDLEYRFDGNQFKFKRPPKDRVISNPMDHLGIPLRPPMRNLWRTTTGRSREDYSPRGTIGDQPTENMEKKYLTKGNMISKVSNNIMN